MKKGIKKGKRSKRPTKKFHRKHINIYKELEDRPELPHTDFDPEAYEFWKSVKWDTAWKEFLEYDKDGNFKHKTVWGLIKHLVGQGKESKQQAQWLWLSIGPQDKKNKNKIVPYLGDWGYNRSCLWEGEVKRESLLFGNPKVAAVRELVKNHIDVLEISKGFGELLMGWLARYDTWARQIDEKFAYNLFDPKLNSEKNEKRFAQYTKMQEYVFNRTIDCTHQVLKCFGVGKDDLSLLTQMMIASMRNKLGDTQANMMMAAASGLKIIEGSGQLGMGQPESDKTVIDGSTAALENNPQLKLMFGTFLGKSKIYNMQHPDVDIDGVDIEDTRTDPAKDPPKTITGKTNGKAKVQ